MIVLPGICCLRPSLALFLTLGLGALVRAAGSPAPAIRPTPAAVTAPASSAPTVSLPAHDWQRDYTPAQFRQLAAAQQPVDPVRLDESLLAAAIFQETNQQRATLGFPALRPDDRAATAARLHSAWMARHHALSHDEPADQGPLATVRDRLARQEIRPHVAAENIAYNFALDLAPGRPFYARVENGRNVYSYRSGGPALRAYTYAGFARAVVAQWMRSPPHRANLLDPTLRFLGVGVAAAHQPDHPDTIYATQDFYAPHLPAAALNVGDRGATLLPTSAR